jgi:type IV secretory pathway VirB2 component (pilin)
MTTSKYLNSKEIRLMDKVISFLDKVPDWLKPVGFALSIIMFVAAGILMMMGRNSSEKAKIWIAYICIGLGVIFMGVEIATTIKNAAS